MMNTTDNKSALQFLRTLAQKYGDRPALFGRKPSGKEDLWYSFSFQQIHQNAEKLARKLIALGLKKNDKVLVYAKSCPEYSVGFFAGPLAGGVTVPLDVRLTVADQKYIAEFSEAKFLLCTDKESLVTSQNLASQLRHSVQIINIGEVIEDQRDDKAIDLAKYINPSEDMAVLTFTSGTTSLPKGAMLSWNNLSYQIDSLMLVFKEKTDFRMLSILPLHHMFEITAGFLVPLNQGGSIYYANSIVPHQIISFLKYHGIRDILAVPLFLSSLKKGILSEIQRSKLTHLWFKTSYAVARFIPSKVIRKYIFFPLHKKFGGELRQIISGASALDSRVAKFFEVLGISIYEGFGMTETSPVISCSSCDAVRPGSVGKVISGTSVKIHSETQELLVRGPGVMLGYYKNPEATAACLSADGWLNTGDVAEIDKDGFVYIKGRNKDVIVLGSGKKVAPEEVENCFRDISDLQDVCVVGMKSTGGPTRGTEVVTVVGVQNPASTLSKEELQELLRQASIGLSYYKRPSRFILLDEPLPRTSTLKIKKNLVKELLIKERIEI